ncbi:ethanolamine ammonia-lyase subunit EutC [Mangrovitalea sediminis]|uniref:ethanolamine ammonia-lyase subunit EutC n=1 Tax=Mangrovitalea sediminis TaxID=1982043 RepID=UPI000BE58633|nr:ethanolamine ammonia-lyase subunit EutC [Mangrovitalea sediminis]
MSRWVQPNPWEQLRRHTAARIALGRVGASLPTAEVLRFGLAHAQARDAVLTPMDTDHLCETLENNGFPVLRVASRCEDRPTYLMRPDWGRQLNERGRHLLGDPAQSSPVAIVVGDGLSSVAVEHHALPLLLLLRQRLELDWARIPVILARQARVALADEIGQLLGAEVALMLIGERPGLSSPDSLGAYLTYRPKVGRNDGERNCVSNIRPQGLSYPLAAQKIAYLMEESLRRQLSGVGLKDDSMADVALLADRR